MIPAPNRLFTERHDGKTRGFTLVEVIFVVAITGILASIATVAYDGQRDKSRINKAILDVRTISLSVEAYYNDNGTWPTSLADVRKDKLLDPWGKPYRYLNIAMSPPGAVRKDKFLVPLNMDFDLYSMGRDRDSKPPLTAKVSRDDIIRANNGDYVGPASGY
jgi:general secretion pathway protein G